MIPLLKTCELRTFDYGKIQMSEPQNLVICQTLARDHAEHWVESSMTLTFPCHIPHLLLSLQCYLEWTVSVSNNVDWSFLVTEASLWKMSSQSFTVYSFFSIPLVSLSFYHVHKKPSSLPSRSMLILGKIYFNIHFDVSNRTRMFRYHY